MAEENGNVTTPDPAANGADNQPQIGVISQYINYIAAFSGCVMCQMNKRIRSCLPKHRACYFRLPVRLFPTPCAMPDFSH